MPSSSHSTTHDKGHRQAQEEEEDEWLVFCRCEKAKSVYTLLSCLRNIGVWVNNSSTRATNDKRDSLTQNRRRTTAPSSIQPVTVFCYPKNVTFHVVGKSKQIQASVSMQAGLFSQYKVLQNAGANGDEESKTDDWHSEGEVSFRLVHALVLMTDWTLQHLTG